MRLDLHLFRRVNVARCNSVFHTMETRDAHSWARFFRDHPRNWTPTEWGCALAGEVGELCNLIKKVRRGEDIDQKALADEIGDVQAYLDLLAASLDVDLSAATIDKFEQVNERRKARQFSIIAEMTRNAMNRTGMDGGAPLWEAPDSPWKGAKK